MADYLKSSTLRRYSACVASVVMATAISFAATPWFGGRSPIAPFLAAVLFSAWYGGLWPGLSATLSTIVIAHFLLERTLFDVLPIQSGWPLLVSFGALGITISFVAEKVLTANAELIRRKNLLEEANQRLSLELVERKKAEDQYKLISENTADVIWLWNLAMGQCAYVSPSVSKLRGFTPAEVMEQPMEKTMPSKTYQLLAAELQRRISAVESGDEAARSKTSQIEFLRKDGTTVSTETLTTLLTDERGAVSQIVGVTRDITERKLAQEDRGRLEERLRQAQKLEGIGRLAGGVAHEFNNLLTVINGYSQLLLARLAPSDPSHSFAELIKSSGERAASLTKQLLAFGRKQLIRPTTVDLNNTVQTFADMLKPLIGEHISLVTKLDSSCGEVMMDPDQLHQVMMNLVLNARDAMPNGGRLEILTAVRELGEGESAVLGIEAPIGQYAALTVTDNGRGMDETTRQHVFEPFFTTKQVGEGTGLGLATVYGIIRQSNGWITVQSELGVGSSFKIYLPRIDLVPSQGESKRTTVKPEGGAETVLVVDDQESVLSFTKAALAQYGYHVMAAADGEDAIALAAQHPGQIDLLLTDVILPGMNGRAVSELLKAQRPNLRVVYTSGYTADVLGQGGELDYGVTFLSKPFSTDELAAKVREVLAQPETLQ